MKRRRNHLPNVRMSAWKVWALSLLFGLAVWAVAWAALELVFPRDGGVLGNLGLAILAGVLGWSGAMYRLGPHLDFNKRPADRSTTPVAADGGATGVYGEPAGGGDAGSA